MTLFCAASAVKLPLVQRLLRDVDCNVDAVSQAGYQAIAGPGSQVAFILTALMTIYVALFGMRLMFGFAPLRVGDATVSALKIGLILALATSWPTYQLLIYDTLFRGPEQFAATMMNAMHGPQSLLRGSPFDGLQAVYDKLQAVQPDENGAKPAAPLQLAALILVLSTLGVVLAAKIVLGLLLALGPLFIAFLLFDGTRGLFEGWLRAALAFALVPLFVTLALTVQLILIAPHLAGVPADAASGAAIFILVLVSVGVSLAGVTGILVTATGLKLRWNLLRPAAEQMADAGASARIAPAAGPVALPQPLQPRVASVSAAAAAMARRDMQVQTIEPPRRLVLGALPERDGHDGERAARGYRRAARPRRGASSRRRDA